MGYLYTRDSLLMVVADGMCGHARGDSASQLTLHTIAALLQRQSDPMVRHSGDVVRLCSEGLWGVLHDRQIIDVFSDRTVMRAVPDLVSDGLEAAGPEADNCTAVAMAWAGAEAVDMVPPSDAPVSTLVIPDGAVATTIQF